jgi:hypothetical protein
MVSNVLRGRRDLSSLTTSLDKANVQDILEKGLDDLSDLCDVVIEKFETAQEEYHKLNPR